MLHAWACQAVEQVLQESTAIPQEDGYVKGVVRGPRFERVDVDDMTSIVPRSDSIFVLN